MEWIFYLSTTLGVKVKSTSLRNHSRTPSHRVNLDLDLNKIHTYSQFFTG